MRWIGGHVAAPNGRPRNRRMRWGATGTRSVPVGKEQAPVGPHAFALDIVEVRKSHYRFEEPRIHRWLRSHVRAGAQTSAGELGYPEEVGVEHVQPGSDERQASDDLESTPVRRQKAKAFEPTDRKAAKRNGNGSSKRKGEQ